MIRHARTVLLLTAAALLLAACSGWQLRGQTSTPELESITLDGASARLRYTLEDELEPSGVLIHGESQNIVMILDERWDSRTAAVDARGRAAERELRYEITWQLVDRDTEAMLNPPRRISALRSFAYSPDNVTATSDEEELVRDDLYEDVAYRLINQLANAARKIDSRNR